MSKKTWIKVKRGLTEKKHRDKLGIRVWLYLEILDMADWETGTVTGWKDKDVAEDMGMPWRTLQDQRQQLDADGYITCVQEFQSQKITIHNYTNPREYSGEVRNKGTQSSVPNGTTHPNAKFRTPTYNSQTTNKDPQKKEKKEVVVNRSSIIRALFEAGIKGEKVQQQLASLDHVTPEYIKAHSEYAKRKGLGVGLLIHRIRDGDAEPENGGHRKNCQCEQCRKKYTEGKFAEHIES